MFKKNKKKIAERYANVFLAQAIQSGGHKRISSDPSFLQNQFTEYPSLGCLLNNPTILRNEKCLNLQPRSQPYAVDIPLNNYRSI